RVVRLPPPAHHRVRRAVVRSAVHRAAERRVARAAARAARAALRATTAHPRVRRSGREDELGALADGDRGSDERGAVDEAPPRQQRLELAGDAIDERAGHVVPSYSRRAPSTRPSVDSTANARNPEVAEARSSGQPSAGWAASTAGSQSCVEAPALAAAPTNTT